jgi:hypothetical protein
METEPASETLCFLKKLSRDKSPKKEEYVINFSCALFSLFDLRTFEDRGNRLSQNVGKELPFYAT